MNKFIFIYSYGHGHKKGKFQRSGPGRKQAKDESKWAKNISKTRKDKGLAYTSASKPHKKHQAKRVNKINLFLYFYILVKDFLYFYLLKLYLENLSIIITVINYYSIILMNYYYYYFIVINNSKKIFHLDSGSLWLQKEVY